MTALQSVKQTDVFLHTNQLKQVLSNAYRLLSSALNAATATLALKFAKPPTSVSVRLPKPLMAPLKSMPALLILLPVDKLKLLVKKFNAL